MILTNYHSSSSPNPIPPAKTSSSSSSFFLVSTGLVSAAVGATEAAGAALTAPLPMLASNFATSCPLSALANRLGQYFSTVLPDAVIIFWSLSDYVRLTVTSTPSS